MLEMLQSPSGAEMADATGWQCHTVRGAMSNALKKRLGFTILSEKPEKGSRIYRISPPEGL